MQTTLGLRPSSRFPLVQIKKRHRSQQKQQLDRYLARQRLIFLAASIAILGPVLSARSAEPDLTSLKHLSLEEIMQIQIPTVYGASKHEQKTTDAPSSVTIVTREEIQRFGHRTLADILRSVRDFHVTYDRNYAYVGVRGFNRPGDFGGRILILVDGLRLNDPIYDSAGVATDFPIDVDMIERVEVIRGPGSALYGNNAFFAVVNVVTRKAGDINGVEASSEVGSFDTYKGRLSLGKVFNNGLSILLTGTVYDSGGNDRLFIKEFDQPVNNNGVAEGRDDDHFDSFGLTASYKDFTFQTGYVSRRKDVPTGSYSTVFNDPHFYTLDQRSFTRLTYAHDFKQGWSVHADVYWNSYYYDGDYPGAYDPSKPRQITILHDLVAAQWWGAQFQVSKQFFKTHRVTLGFDYQDNFKLKLADYDIEPRYDYLRLQISNQTFGAYLQDEWAITRNLSLTAGLRYDWFEEFGGTLNPRAALIYHPWKPTTLKFLYGQAFRAPNVFETSYAASGYEVNPNIGPEHIRSYEAVLEQNLTPAIRLNVSGFYNQIKDLISENVDPRNGNLFFDNLSGAETKGGSFELEATLPKGVKPRLSYTLQRTINVETGEQLSNSPEQLVKLGLIVPLYRDKIFSGIELQYSSDVENIRHEKTSGYLLANGTLFSRELIKNLEISASVYNLFDKKYGFPGGPEHLQSTIQQDGRTFRMKLTYHF